jgi:pimeloyl-ACP methyl ester carboxylesterase
MEFQHLFRVFAYLKMQMYLIDMPGMGHSNGDLLKSRSNMVLDKGGPADLIKLIISQLDLGRPDVLGYDWGGAIALKMSIQNSKTFRRVMVLCPSYSEEPKEELRKIKNKTLVIWCK